MASDTDGKFTLKNTPIKPQLNNPEGFYIRNFQPNDKPHLLEIQAAALQSSTGFYTSVQIGSLIQSQAFERNWEQETILVAISSNEIIGFITSFPSIAKITGIYVHPDHQRQGVGSQLLQRVEEIAVTHGHFKMRISASLIAEDFYKANGYESGKETGFYSSCDIWIPVIPCIKKISPRPPLKKFFIDYIKRPKNRYKPLFFIVKMVVTSCLVILSPLVLSVLMSLLEALF